MPAQSHEFVGEDVLSPTALAEVLGTGTRISPDLERVVNHQWFDTFDWRLNSAGLTLERDTARHDDRAQLRLSELSGRLVQVASGGPEAVAPDAARAALPLEALVPAGPMRARLAPIVEMRALLPVAAVTARMQAFRVLNSQAKTVARLVLEESTGERPSSRTPAYRLSVRAVRGYQAEADRLARGLAGLPGLRPSDTLPMADALVAAGRRPGDYSGKLEVRLTPTLPAAAAVRAILARLVDGAEANVPGVVADLDTEFLHDLRVAVRRARSALKLLGDALPSAEAAGLITDLKWMGDLTTPTRDLDVYLLQTGAGDPDAVGEELQPFRTFLRRRRRLAQRSLVRGLRSQRWAGALGRWRALASPPQKAIETRAASLATSPIGEVAMVRIERAYRRAVSLGSLITPSSPAADLHTLRKRCKELRYLLEFFSSLLAPLPYRAVLDQLKSLQDCLGEFQDTQVQRTAMESFAEEMLAAGGTAATTFMAMGRAADRLEFRQRQARELFTVRFARFANKATHQHVARLDPTPTGPPALRGQP